jgi:hypothetical protein
MLANVAYYAAATPEEIASSGVTVASYFMEKVFGTAASRALRYSFLQHSGTLQSIDSSLAFSSHYLPLETS